MATLANNLSQQQPDLASLLASVKASLTAERRAYCEQQYLVYHVLLSTTQGAWLLCHLFPNHCDCMLFLKGLRLSSDV